MDINILVRDILKVFFFIIHVTYLFLNIQIFSENINVTNNIKTELQNCNLSKNKAQNISSERCY